MNGEIVGNAAVLDAQFDHLLAGEVELAEQVGKVTLNLSSPISYLGYLGDLRLQFLTCSFLTFSS